MPKWHLKHRRIRGNGQRIFKKRKCGIKQKCPGVNSEAFRRCGRGSNPRPPAWQAGILTKLNYRTKAVAFSESGCKCTHIFWFCKFFAEFFILSSKKGLRRLLRRGFLTFSSGWLKLCIRVDLFLYLHVYNLAVFRQIENISLQWINFLSQL